MFEREVFEKVVLQGKKEWMLFEITFTTSNFGKCMLAVNKHCVKGVTQCTVNIAT